MLTAGRLPILVIATIGCGGRFAANTDGGATCVGGVLTTTSEGASAIAADGDAIYWANADPVELHRFDSSGDVVVASIGDISNADPVVAIARSGSDTYFSTANALWYLGASGPQLIDAHGGGPQLVSGSGSVFVLGTSEVAQYSTSGLLGGFGGLSGAVGIAVDGTTVFVGDVNGLEAFSDGATSPTRVQTISGLADIAAFGGSVFLLASTSSTTATLSKYEQGTGTMSLVADELSIPLHPRLAVSQRYAYVWGPSRGDDLFMPIAGVSQINLADGKAIAIASPENATIPNLIVLNNAVVWAEQSAHTTFSGHALTKFCE